MYYYDETTKTEKALLSNFVDVSKNYQHYSRPLQNPQSPSPFEC
jgi:hypothetical protein